MTTEAAGRSSLAVSVVTYSPDLCVLGQVLASLDGALEEARQFGVLDAVRVVLVDNGPGTQWRDKVRGLMQQHLHVPQDAVQLLSGHGNVGYGRGHNLAIARSVEDYHLVLNPDVITERGAIREALAFMEAHRDVGFLTPAARGPEGGPQYLCKRYPSVLDLLLRGFAPDFVRSWFRARLDRYEMKAETGDAVKFDIPVASGSFMFLRRSVLDQIGGFSDAFFLYFEDFDLSVRLSKVSRIVYVPAVRITHLGGRAAKKGVPHIGMFIRSGFTFFARHGWKWL